MSESENTVVSFGRDPNTIKRLREERAEFEKWGQTLSALERLQSKKLDLRFPRWRAFAQTKMLEAKSHIEYLEKKSLRA